LSTWRTLRLEAIRLVRQPWRLALFIGLLVGTAWLLERIPEHGLGNHLLRLLMEVPGMILAGAIMILPPVRAGSSEQDMGAARDGEAEDRSSSE